MPVSSPVRQIPFFPYAQLFKADETGLLEVMREVCARGAYILQSDCRDFETELARYMGVRHVLGVANGTDAIILGLRAAGIGPGDEVILPSHTYIASAAAIHWVGATPVLAECGTDHMLDPNDISPRITSRTRAIMPVHINGRTCDMDAITTVAEDHGLMIVEDAAQGLGSRFKGRSAGTFGVFGTISFYPAKLLGCFGDGGAIVTNDDEVATRLALLRDHGRDAQGRVVAWGYNSRLDNLQAAILRHKLRSFPSEVARRRSIAASYEAGLRSCSALHLPPPPSETSDHFDVFQNYEIEADDRDGLKKHLESLGIRTLIQWSGTPVHGFSELGFTQRLPRTDKIFQRCLMLPMNTALTDDEVDYIIEGVRAFYE
ncbi:MAG: DegT/DnrJ/EryC1/StrS family aminotransferase [Gemmatimonadales bacterium]